MPIGNSTAGNRHGPISDFESRILAHCLLGCRAEDIAAKLRVDVTSVVATLDKFDVDESSPRGNATGDRRLLELVASTIPDIIFVFDLVSCRNVYSSNRLSTVLGYEPSQEAVDAIGFLKSVVHPEDWSSMIEHLQGIRKDKGATQVSHEYRVIRQDGQYRWILSRKVVFERDGDGYPTLIAGIASDITDRKRLEERFNAEIIQRSADAIQMSQRQEELERANALLAKQASSDGLTGLTNHRVFQELLESEIERCHTMRSPLSVVFLDIDHFKLYNDEFGHPAGDELLRQLGRLMLDVSRDNDVVARYGGEEFAIILPDTTQAGCVGFAERLQTAISAEPWPRRPITVSMGCATWCQHESRADLLDRADDALYVSKRRGRNCYSVAEQPWPKWANEGEWRESA